MVTVPTYQRNQRDRTAGRTRFEVGTTAASFGAQIGSAMANLGTAGVRVADAMQARAMMDAEKDANDAFAEARDRASRLQYEPGEGYFTTTGENATGEARKTFNERMDGLGKEYAASIEDPAAREAFEEKWREYQFRAVEKARGHAATQGRTAYNNAADAVIQSDINEALANWDDDAEFERYLNRALQGQADLAAVNGTPEEVLQLGQETLVSELTRNRVVRIAEESPEAAQEYIDANRDRLQETDLHKLETELEPMIRQRRAQRRLEDFRTDTPGGRDGSIIMANQGQIRDEPLSDRLTEAMGYLGDMGITTKVFSGGQTRGPGMVEEKDYTGSTRHDGGNAADVTFYKDGRALKATNPEDIPILQEIVFRGRMAGMTGFGMDDHGYMGPDRMHIGFGAEAVWGAGGAGENAPDWLKEAATLPLTPANVAAVTTFGFAAAVGARSLARMDPSAPASEAFKGSGRSWSDVVAQNPWLQKDMTVGQMRRAAAKHAGDGPVRTGSRAAVPEYDFAGAYAHAATIQDPEERAAFIKEVEGMELLLQRQEEAARGEIIDRATDEFIQTGELSLTMGDRLTLGADGIAVVQSLVQGVETGNLIDQPKTTRQLNELLARVEAGDMAAAEKFVSEGYLQEFRGNLTQATYAEYVAKRDAMRAARAGQIAQMEQIGQNPAAYVNITSDDRTEMERRFDVATSEKTSADAREVQLAEFETAYLRELQRWTQANPGKFIEAGNKVPRHIRRGLLDGLMLTTAENNAAPGAARPSASDALWVFNSSSRAGQDTQPRADIDNLSVYQLQAAQELVRALQMPEGSVDIVEKIATNQILANAHMAHMAIAFTPDEVPRWYREMHVAEYGAYLPDVMADEFTEMMLPGPGKPYYGVPDDIAIPDAQTPTRPLNEVGTPPPPTSTSDRPAPARPGPNQPGYVPE